MGASLRGRVNSAQFTRLKNHIKIPKHVLFYKSKKSACSVRMSTQHQKLKNKIKEDAFKEWNICWATLTCPEVIYCREGVCQGLTCTRSCPVKCNICRKNPETENCHNHGPNSQIQQPDVSKFKGMSLVEIADRGALVWERGLWLLRRQAACCIAEQRENLLGLKYNSRNHRRWEILALPWKIKQEAWKKM